MKNKKGQALVEFIVILPVLVYIILVMIDIFVIYNKKSMLESSMNEVVYLYKNNRTGEIEEYLNKDLDNHEYKVKVDGKYTYLYLDYKYQFIAPGLGNILGANYKIKSERVIVND